MAKEAEAHSAEDKEKREEIDARNSLDSLVYNIEKMLKEPATRCRDRRRPRWSRCWPSQRRCWKARRSSTELKAAHEKLTHASHKLAEVMYKAQAAAGARRHRGDAPGQKPAAEAKEGRRCDRR